MESGYSRGHIDEFGSHEIKKDILDHDNIYIFRYRQKKEHTTLGYSVN